MWRGLDTELNPKPTIGCFNSTELSIAVTVVSIADYLSEQLLEKVGCDDCERRELASAIHPEMTMRLTG